MTHTSIYIRHKDYRYAIIRKGNKDPEAAMYLQLIVTVLDWRHYTITKINSYTRIYKLIEKVLTYP